MPTSAEKLKKLESLLKLVDESISRADFERSFKAVLDYVKGIKARNDEIIGRIESDYQKLSGNLKDGNSAQIAEAIKELRSDAELKSSREIVRLTNALESAISRIEDRVSEKLRSVRDGVDGKSVDEKKLRKVITDDVKSEVYSLIEELRKELKDDMKAGIKSIPERPTTTIFGPGKTRVYTLDLSSQLDGATKEFKIGTHFGVISVNSDSAPFGAFRPVVDFTEVGKNIVFTDAIDAAISLAAGHSLIIRYLR